MSQYCYSDLSDGAANIRLLRLKPYGEGNDEKTELQCELFVYSLQDERRSSHRYEALSYTWGGEKKPCSIFIEGHEFHVTVNLYEALLRLRDRLVERILWVDAVCINQTCLEEKGQQVPLMALIYSKAYCVIVWLGETTEDVEGALECIQCAANEERADSISNETAVLNLLQRQWFQRVWVRDRSLD